MPVRHRLRGRYGRRFAPGVRLISLLLVVLITAFNSALDRLLIEIEQHRNTELATRRLAAIVESSDDAIIYEASGILNWALQGYMEWSHQDCNQKLSD
jgi:hypothetical protein